MAYIKKIVQLNRKEDILSLICHILHSNTLTFVQICFECNHHTFIRRYYQVIHQIKMFYGSTGVVIFVFGTVNEQDTLQMMEWDSCKCMECFDGLKNVIASNTGDVWEWCRKNELSDKDAMIRNNSYCCDRKSDLKCFYGNKRADDSGNENSGNMAYCGSTLSNNRNIKMTCGTSHTGTTENKNVEVPEHIKNHCIEDWKACDEMMVGDQENVLRLRCYDEKSVCDEHDVQGEALRSPNNSSRDINSEMAGHVKSKEHEYTGGDNIMVEYRLMNKHFFVPPSNKKKYHTVVLGGTFDRFHEGHILLLTTALLLASDELTIGLTTKRLHTNKKYNAIIESYDIRKNKLLFLCRVMSNARVTLNELNDSVGKCLKDDYECIVVSTESFVRACEINFRRMDVDKKMMDIIVTPVIEYENVRLSSTGLRKKEAIPDQDKS